MDQRLLEEYLRRYPSGHFAELAQLQLDQLLARQGEKKIEIASSAGNPFTQGSMRADIGFKVGDSYSYVELDLDSKTEKHRHTDTVLQIADDQVMFSNRLILDRLGNTIQLPDGRRFTPRQDQPLEYAVGRKWTTRYGGSGTAGRTSDIEFEFRITGRERITVPAGSFDCYVIEGQGSGLNDMGGRLALSLKRWMAPDKVRRPIAAENYRRIDITRGAGGPGGQGGMGGFGGRGRGGPGKGAGGGGRTIEKVLNSDRRELIAYTQT